MSDSHLPLLHDAPFTDPQQVLEAILGYREFRPGQRRIIDAVLAGHDCIGVMPTGAGKSDGIHRSLRLPIRVVSAVTKLSYTALLY